jgi:copper ion binding protein
MNTMSDNAPGASRHATIAITGMNCQHCVQKVTSALTTVPGVRDVHVDLAAKNARVRFEPPATAGRLMQAVNQSGFQATGFTRD